MRAKLVTWARLPSTKPATCSTHQLTMPIFCTCVQAMHPKSVQCVCIHIIPVQCSIVVAVVVMVEVSQVTAQSSKNTKKKEKKKLRNPSEPCTPIPSRETCVANHACAICFPSISLHAMRRSALDKTGSRVTSLLRIQRAAAAG